METFSYPFNVEDGESIDAYARDLDHVRDKALAKPLVPGCTFSCVIAPPKSPSHTTSTRPLPWFAKQAECTMSCELQWPLKTGVDNWSQVWVARVGPLHGADVEPGPSHVVMKFIQPSMLPLPNYDSVRMSEYKLSEELAKKETFMYSLLESLQGNVVPYFFGLQTVSHLFIYPTGIIIKHELTHRSLHLPGNRRGFC